MSKAVSGSSYPSPRRSDRQLRDMKVSQKKTSAFVNKFEVRGKSKPPKHLAALETGMNAAYKYSKRHDAFNVPHYMPKWQNAAQKMSIAAFLAEPIL